MTEKKTKPRKTDRRTVYTRNVVKDALLELLEQTTFEKVTVAAVCKQAEVTRATFYIHYDNLTAVLDEVLDDALRITEHESADPNEDMFKILSILNRENNVEELKKHDTLLPVCQRVADQPKYHVLFLDETLSSYIIKKMYQAEKEKMVPKLIQQCHLSRKEAEKVFQFVIYGAYEVNKSMHWKKDEEWYQLQNVLIKFVLGGFGSLT